MPFDKDTSGWETIKKNAEELGSTDEVRFLDLMNPAFISNYTGSADFQSLCAAAGYQVDKVEDLEAVPDDLWNAFVAANTKFSSWEEMQKKAWMDYLEKSLHRGL